MKWVLGGLVVAVLALVGGYFVLQGEDSQAPVAQAVEDEAVPEQRTVIMIPGYGGGTGQLRKLGGELKKAGIDWEIMDVDNGQGDLNEYADRVEKRAGELQKRGQIVDLIGYSAGGITARIAATEDPQDYRKVVTIAAPHDGTSWADLGASFGECPPACQQLRPNSGLLESLAPVADDDWLSVYSKTDEVIRPPESSRLRGAVIRPVQNACPREVVNHGVMPQHPQTIALVIAFLENEDLPGLCAVPAK